MAPRAGATVARDAASSPTSSAPLPEPAPAEAGITPVSEPAPADVTLTITKESGRSQRVVVHRPGYLVALLHGAARSAGKDRAALRVQVPEVTGKPRSARPGVVVDRLIWESTRLGSFATERGLVSLSLSSDGARLDGNLALAAPPASAGETRGPHFTCASHHDGAGGFTALCRLDARARRITAANVTGLRVIEGAVVAADAADKGAGPLVRLDLPLAPGVGEARVVGFTLGRVGHALRAEASWAPGEAPALFFSETERLQPQAPEFF
ncbi:MAG: hypothetical protein ABI134_16440 [Byssovorax sp.]